MRLRPILRLFIAAALIFSISIPAIADPGGLYLTEGLMGYEFSFNNSPTSVTQRLYLSSETGLGYIIDGWFYLGGIFNYTAVNEQTSDGGGTTTNHQETFQYYGPSIGYMTDSWYFLAHYFANAEKKDSLSGAASGTVDNTGNGFGFTIGYKIPIGSFEIAPAFSLKFINYTNCKDPNTGATSSCNPTIQQNEVDPYVTLLFNFK